MKKLFCVTTGLGMTIREGKDEDSVYASVLREVGTYNGVREVKEATPDDIAWVAGMGGRIPKSAESILKARRG